MEEDHNNNSIESDFDEYEDDFYYKSRTEKKHRAFVKKIEGKAVYDVKNSQQLRVKKISSLEIPLRSREVLIKLVINRQLEEIKSVKRGNNSIVLHCVMNENFASYHRLKRNEVMMKIFLGKNNKKPDVERAASTEIFSQALRKHGDFNKKPLNIMTIENIIVMKMIGDTHPAKNLFEMVEENPKNVRKYLREILTLISKMSTYHWTWEFWKEKMSANGILFYNNSWVLLDRKTKNYGGEDSKLANLMTIFEIFKEFGMSKEEILEEFSIINFTENKAVSSTYRALKYFSNEIFITELLKLSIEYKESIEVK